MFLDGVHVSKIEANFGQSYRGLSILEVVVCRALSSPHIHGHLALCVSITSYFIAYLEVRHQSSVFRLVKAFFNCCPIIL